MKFNPEQLNTTGPTPEKMRSILQDVIDGSFNIFDIESMANYDAEFSGEEPYFINIWNKQEGFGFGYIVFHDFLRRVGIEKTFTSTNFTDAGRALFQKATTDGLIEKVSEPSGLQMITRWKVVGDPTAHLIQMKDLVK